MKNKELLNEVQELKTITLEQNREIIRLKEDIRHYKWLANLYYMAATGGKDLDFPDVTGRGKGVNTITGNNNFD